jgi:hypothetical protein
MLLGFTAAIYLISSIVYGFGFILGGRGAEGFKESFLFVLFFPGICIAFLITSLIKF